MQYWGDNIAMEQENNQIKHYFSEKIRNTPVASKKEVEKYHSMIKQEMDSGVLISNPCPDHRELHQLMWVEGYKIYNGFKDLGEAFNYFCSCEGDVSKCPSNTCRSEKKCQRTRFNMWYVEEYILKIPEYKQDEWMKNLIKEARQDANRVYGKELEEIVASGLLIAA